MTAISGWPARLRSGSTDDPAGAVERRAGAARQLGAERRGGDAGGPDHGAAGEPLRRAGAAGRRRLVGDALGVDAGDPRSRCAPRRRAARAARGPAPRAAARRRRAPGPSPRAGRPGSGSSRCGGTPRQRVLRDLAHRAGHLHPGRAAADHGEGHPGVALGRVGGALGPLEGADDAGADVERVGQRLQARRVRRPFVVAEVAVRGAGGDDQVVPGDPLAAVDADAAAGDVDRLHLGLQDRQVAALHLPLQHVADRRADRRRAEAGGRHLVEQGLEQVVVGAVDEDDLDRRLRQRPHRLDAAEAAADHQHARPRHQGFPAAAGSTGAAGSISRSATMWMWARRAYSSSA